MGVTIPLHCGAGPWSLSCPQSLQCRNSSLCSLSWGEGDRTITCSQSWAPFVASAGRQEHRSFQMNGAISSYNPYELIKLFSITYII